MLLKSWIKLFNVVNSEVSHFPGCIYWKLSFELSESKPGDEKCEFPKYTDFLNCLQQKLFNLCPESKPDNECKEIKEFMEKCPNAQRIFKASQLSTMSPIKDNLAEAMREVING